MGLSARRSTAPVPSAACAKRFRGPARRAVSRHGHVRGAGRRRQLHVGGDVKAPRKIVDVKSLYPEEARATQVGGVVVLEGIIATDGSVSNARVVSTPRAQSTLRIVRLPKPLLR